jgi:regulatory protein
MAHRRRGPRLHPAELRERRAAVDDVGQVLDAAARFLEARSRSTAEVRRRLTSAGYRGELVETALERLTAQGYLDDAAFARAWIESRDRARPRGERALRSELAQKGIDRGIIDLVLAARAEQEAPSERFASGAERDTARSADEIAATHLLERHRRALMREADPRKRRQRAYALLARSGFDPGTSGTVAATIVDAAAIADEDASGDSEAS